MPKQNWKLLKKKSKCYKILLSNCLLSGKPDHHLSVPLGLTIAAAEATDPQIYHLLRQLTNEIVMPCIMRKWLSRSTEALFMCNPLCWKPLHFHFECIMAPSHAGPSNAIQCWENKKTVPNIIHKGSNVLWPCCTTLIVTRYPLEGHRSLSNCQSQLFDLQLRRAQADNYSFTEKPDR